MTKNTYNENSIKEMAFPECIQKRPSMYIGSIDVPGNTHLIREVIDNSVDEALNGYGKVIKIHISSKKGYCTVEDEGRGIPAKAIQKAFCTIHASGKFDNEEYTTSAGTNGVGCTAVNALSTKFYVECTNDDVRYSQEFSNGEPVTTLKKIGPAKGKKGTFVEFRPNKEFMGTNEFSTETIIEEMRDKVYVLPGVTIEVNDDDEKKKYTFLKKSLSSYVDDNCKNGLNKPCTFGDKVEFTDKLSKKTKKFEYELSFAYAAKGNSKIRSFCNSLVMREGGIQETSLKTAMCQFFKKYIEDNKLIPKKDGNLEITVDHCADGLVCVLSIKHPSPIFENQTKNKLTNKEVASIKKTIIEHLEEFAVSNPKEVKNICNKIILNAKAADAARKAKENTMKSGENQFSIVSDLSKLAPCISKDPKLIEILIAEGTSASGTAKEARDKMIQAVYSLRGKMLNTLGMETNKVLANKECADLAYILTGIKNAIDENFKIEYLKYDKVIMLCDADVDGR